MKDSSKPKVLIPFHQIRLVPLWLVLLFLTIDSINSIWINLFLFSSNIFDGVIDTFQGLVNLTLIANLFNLLVFTVLIVVIGRVSFWELGIKGEERLSRAVSILMTVWVAVQVLNVMAGVFTPFESLVDKRWTEGSVLPIVGGFLGHLLGNALFEELAHRGLLLIQVIKRMGRTRHPVLYGTLLSQLIFALLHIPNRIYQRLSFEEILVSLLIVYIYGLIFAAMYLLTDNLFLVIGFHTMVNAPTFFFDGDMTYPGIIGAMLLVTLLWRHYTQAREPMPLRPLETERLILRPWHLSDVKDLYEYAKSDLVGPSAGWKPHSSIGVSREVIRSFIENGDVYAISLKSTGKVIGSVGIHEKYPDSNDRSPGQREIGYVLNPAYWGNGYMPEAVEAVKAFCFDDLGIKKLWCGHFVDNHKSRRVIEKCGFDYVLTKETVLVGMGNKKVITKFYCIDRGDRL